MSPRLRAALPFALTLSVAGLVRADDGGLPEGGAFPDAGVLDAGPLPDAASFPDAGSQTGTDAAAFPDASGSAGSGGGGAGGADPGYPVADSGTPDAILAMPCTAWDEPLHCLMAEGLVYDRTVQLPIAFDWDTGWVPGGSPVQVRFYVKLPAYTHVGMKGSLQTTWPKSLDLDPLGLRATGQLDFDYGLQIGAKAKIKIAGFGWEGDIPYLPNFDFHMKGVRLFDPWAFDPGTKASGYTPKLTLFKVPITDIIVKIPGISGGIELDVQGELQVKYRTDKIVITPHKTPSKGPTPPVTQPDASTIHPWVQGAWAEYKVHPEGTVTYVGTLHLVPALYVEVLGKKLSIPVGFDYPISLTLDEQTWIFDDQLVHVPLPDVRLPKGVTGDVIPFGPVEAGDQKIIELKFPNIGEAKAKATASLDKKTDFSLLGSSATFGPGEDGSISVRFSPKSAGTKTAKLTVTTNDPDTPEIALTLSGDGYFPDAPPAGTGGSTGGKGGSANGAAGSGAGPEAPGGPKVVDDPNQEGGCGCEVPARDHGGALALAGGLALAAGLRRRAHRCRERALPQDPCEPPPDRDHSLGESMTRRLFRSLVVSCATITASSIAFAADPPCDPTTYSCVIANNSAPVKLAKTMTDVPFQNKLNSGWVGCGSNQNESCTGAPSQKCTIGACVQAAMNDSKVEIAMQSLYDVSWTPAEPGKLKVTPRPKTNSGNLKVTYTLTPLIGIHIDAFGFNGTVALNPTDILAALGVPDVTKGFNSPANCSAPFDPYSFASPPSWKCHAEGFNDVFAIPLSQLTGLFGLDVGEYIELDLKLQAGTKTDFTWTTTDLQMDTLSPKITAAVSSGNIQYSGEDELDLNVWATGILGYSGSTEIRPAVTVKSVAGIKLGNGLTINVPVGAEVPFAGQVPNIQLTKTSVNIPLPNILVNTGGIAFGEAAVGQSVVKKLKIQNTGKLLLKATVSSTDPSFSFDKTKLDIPARVDATPGSYDLTITFIPKKVGGAPATMKIASNDVDEPLLEIPLTGAGTGDEPAGTGGSGGAPAAGGSGGTPATGGAGGKKSAPQVQEDDSDAAGGCHCQVVGERGAPLGGLVLGAVGLFLGLRRRRA